MRKNNTLFDCASTVVRLRFDKRASRSNNCRSRLEEMSNTSRTLLEQISKHSRSILEAQSNKKGFFSKNYEAKGRFFNNFPKKTSIFSNKRIGNELLPLNTLKGLFEIFLLYSGYLAYKGRNNLPKKLKSTKFWKIVNSQVVLKIFLGNWKNWVFRRDDFC